ncbi:hypothetical protein FG002_013020 [Chitinimonas sp. BJB300]|nr:hypothetical protein FG002_013020 [Chitinimonas sp. BJB300]
MPALNVLFLCLNLLIQCFQVVRERLQQLLEGAWQSILAVFQYLRNASADSVDTLRDNDAKLD